MLEGSQDAKVLFISDFQRVHCQAERRVFSEYMGKCLTSAIQSAGLLASDYALTVIHSGMPPGGKLISRFPEEERAYHLKEVSKVIKESKATILVPLGEYALNFVTGLSSISKWHCNIVQAKAEFGARKTIPLLHPEHIQKMYGDYFYLGFGCTRIKEEMNFKEIIIPERKCILGPSYSDSIKYLNSILASNAPIAVDIETGSGFINTVGFAKSATEAIAIKTLPEFYTQEEFFQLWKKIAAVLESSIPKILQNFIYESTWFARYGIHMRAVLHDTMWAMKFLHPEFEKGLDNVGRVYTKFPYWKDDNDDWNNIRDWNRHLKYNCYDTCGTYAGWEGQKSALDKRGLSPLFNDFVMRFAPVIHEMCTTGLKVDAVALVALQDKLLGQKENFMRIIDDTCQGQLGGKINPRSPKQLAKALKGLGMKLPVQKGKESTDKKALVKLRRKHPDAPILNALIGLSATNKQLSSYVNFDYDRSSGRVHYTLDGCGTETGRWAGYNSGWGEGFNPQTVPKAVRNCFVADPGYTLVQIDLAQAESRYVAWEAPEPTLMQMLEEGRDVHKYVAAKIFKKPEEIVNKQERQLGKKSGHSANYDVGPKTFAEACLVEMNLYLEESEARRIIETYNEVFPGIRKRKANIQAELWAKRMLKTPLGRERHFYGRLVDATFREAYAYAPQSTIPDITNHLMLKLFKEREYLGIDQFLLQVHDSLLLQVEPDRVQDIHDLAHDLKAWHPKIILPGGDLWIPVEVEVGTRWGKMEVI